LLMFKYNMDHFITEMVSNSSHTECNAMDMGTMVDVDTKPIDPQTVFYRYIAFSISLFLWLFMWANKTDLGKDVFGYKGTNPLFKLRHHLAIYSWWWQLPLVLLSFTSPNNLFLDSLAMFATLVFGGPYYSEFPNMRKWFHLHEHHWWAWDYFFSFIFNTTHHGSVAFIILFENDANKLLYCPIFCWLWFAHSLQQIVLKHGANIKAYVSVESIWTIYWKVAPYLIGYWYVTQFMASDNEYLSVGLLMLFFGRWGLSFNWPDAAKFPKKEQWRDETCQSIIHLVLAYVYCHGVAMSLPMAVVFTVIVCCLQQATDSKADAVDWISETE